MEGFERWAFILERKLGRRTRGLRGPRPSVPWPLFEPPFPHRRDASAAHAMPRRRVPLGRQKRCTGALVARALLAVCAARLSCSAASEHLGTPASNRRDGTYLLDTNLGHLRYSRTSHSLRGSANREKTLRSDEARVDSVLQSRFREVFTQNLWRDGVSRSGWGSNPSSEAVVQDRTFIVETVQHELSQSTLTIVDAPCGDMAWMPETLKLISQTYEHVFYTGMDIVPEIISSNRDKMKLLKQRAGSKVSYNFRLLDISSQRLPSADVVLCRDLVNHLPMESVRKVLTNFLTSNVRYVILSNNVAPLHMPQVAEWSVHDANHFENVGGDSRPLDITKPPLSWPEPLYANSHLGVWSMEERDGA